MNRLKTILLLFSVMLFKLCMSQENCEPCTDDSLQSELRRMIDLYILKVNEARNLGYQCGSDKNYVDHGPLITRLGNCADWAFISWSALVVHTWKCWKVVKIRARKQFRLSHHNFVKIVPKCGGTPIYFDPWRTGRPDRVIGNDNFEFSPGLFGWIHYPLETHLPGAPPKRFQ